MLLENYFKYIVLQVYSLFIDIFMEYHKIANYVFSNRKIFPVPHPNKITKQESIL